MKEGRRKFLQQFGVSLAGLTGLSKLAKAMAEGGAATSSTEPCSTVQWECQPKYQCDQFRGISCQNRFNCIVTHICGPTWFGDFKCEHLEFTCGNFECKGSEPGTQFHCLARFSYCNDFNCDPGDFSCKPEHYSCSATISSTSAYAVPIAPPEP